MASILCSPSGGNRRLTRRKLTVVNADGSTSPGKTRARLDYGGGTTFTDEGDFYLTFIFMWPVRSMEGSRSKPWVACTYGVVY